MNSRTPGRCETRGREFTNWPNAQALEAQHARRYGHVTSGEVGFAFKQVGRSW